MTMNITKQHIDRFEEDGFLVLERILTGEQVEKARAAVYRLFRGEVACDRRPPACRRPIPRRAETSAINHTVNGRLLDNDLWEISNDPHIAEMAAKLLRTESVSLMEDQLIEKSPGGPPLQFHQDAPYLTFLRSWDVINCWIALVDLTPEMAPLICIRGSHRWPVAAMPSKFIGGEESEMMEVVAGVTPPGVTPEEVPVLVPAGGGAFFGALTLHGSHGNTSDKTRYAYTLHYAAAECRADTSRWPANYEPYIVEGIEDNGRIVSPFMPVVYPAFKEVL